MRHLGLLVLCALVAAGTSCGGRENVTAPGPSVAEALVPSKLGDGKLTLAEDPSARKAFARAKGNSLAADGKLWAIRLGPTLVATLQMTTLSPKVDLSRKSDREQIVNSALAGGVETIDISNTTVRAVAAQDRVTFLWFGQRLFEVLQVKATKIDPKDLLTEVLTYQTASPAWEPLVIADEEDEVE